MSDARRLRTCSMLLLAVVLASVAWAAVAAGPEEQARTASMDFARTPPRDRNNGDRDVSEQRIRETAGAPVSNGGRDPHFSFSSLLAAPLMAGTGLRNMPPEIRAILLHDLVIAIDRDRLGTRAGIP